LRAGVGTVHSVFESTVYLQSRDALCCLGCSNLVAGPLNIRSTLDNIANIHQGDTWRYSQNRLTVGQSPTIDAANCENWQPDKDPAQPDLNILYESLKFVNYLISRSTRCCQSANTPTTQLIDKKLTRGMTALRSRVSSQSLSNGALHKDIVTMIGCGDGLTPEGDDILCGAMVALQSLNTEPATTRFCNQVVQLAPTLTGDISFSHLQCASSGQGVEPLHNFVKELLSPTTDHNKLANATDQLIHYGSSSGYRALQGALTVVTGLYQRQS